MTTDISSPGLVDQFLPQIVPRDAASNHTVAMHAALERAGVAGGIWSEMIDPQLNGSAESWRTYTTVRGTHSDRRHALLYQAFMGSPDLVRFLTSRSEPLALYYHNITPGALLRTYDPVAALLMDEGREELRRLVPRARVALAASAFNAGELRRWGAEDVRVLPPYAQARASTDVDQPYLDQLLESRKGIDLLFVGRVVPHKGHRHLLHVMAALRAGWDRPVRLLVVGPPGPEAYMIELRKEVSRLGLDEDVVFTGSITDAQVAAHYRAADLFLCLSEHEGFCLPLVEAMRAGLPVIAFRAGAVPETLSGAGILLGTLDPFVLAEIVVRISTDGGLREQIRERQLRRAGDLDGFDRDAQLLRAVETLTAP